MDKKDKKPTPRVPDDKELVARAKKGDKAAFEGLVKMFSKYVYTTAFFILRDSHEAEDASQEARETARKMGEELKSGYQNIRNKLK